MLSALVLTILFTILTATGVLVLPWYAILAPVFVVAVIKVISWIIIAIFAKKIIGYAAEYDNKK